MNPAPTPSNPTAPDPWTLEVVRGRRVGQRYPVAAGAVILGSSTAGTIGERVLSLADQEGSSPRKMAARHVALEVGPDGLSLTDLDTPGGTFVNNRRLLPGKAATLAAGDLIQLGAVQLRLSRAAGSAASAPPAQKTPAQPLGKIAPVVSHFLYRTSASGATCRTWDDFLPLSAQKWDELRADLVAGKLTALVGSLGRPDLAPRPIRGGPTTAEADEVLHDWLDRLPTRTPATPELDVHPLRLVVPVPSGDVTVARKVQISNVGYGLLRARVRVEGAPGVTLTLSPDFAGREITVRDSVAVGFEVTVPDPFGGPVEAHLSVAGAGEERRITVRVERKTAPAELLPSDFGSDAAATPGPLARFRELSVGKRVAIAALVGLASRLLVGVAGGAIGEDALLASGPDIPRLGGVVLAFGATGAVLGGWWLARQSGRGDLAAGAVAGAGLGALLASAAVALCRVVEPSLGPLAANPLVGFGVWGGVAALLAWLVPTAPVAPKESAR